MEGDADAGDDDGVGYFLASEREASFDRACFPRRGKHSVAREGDPQRRAP